MKTSSRIYAALDADDMIGYWVECKKTDFKVFEYIEGLARGTIMTMNGQLYRLKREKSNRVK